MEYKPFDVLNLFPEQILGMDQKYNKFKNAQELDKKCEAYCRIHCQNHKNEDDDHQCCHEHESDRANGYEYAPSDDNKKTKKKKISKE